MQKYKGDMNLSTALTGLYFQQAPPDVSMPYGVFYFNGATQEEIMGGADNNITQVDIQFNLFTDADDGGGTIAVLVDLLNECYHWKTLLLNGWQCTKFQRVDIMNMAFVDNIWQSTIDYELWMQKE